MDARYGTMNNDGLRQVLAKLGLPYAERGDGGSDEHDRQKQLELRPESGLTESERRELEEIYRRHDLNSLVDAFENGLLNFLLAVDIESLSPEAVSALIKKEIALQLEEDRRRRELRKDVWRKRGVSFQD